MEELRLVDLNKLTFVIYDNMICCINKKNKILAQGNIEDCTLYYYKTEHGLGRCCIAGFYFPQSDKYITMLVNKKDKERFLEFIDRLLISIKYENIRQRDAFKIEMADYRAKIKSANQEVRDALKEGMHENNESRTELKKATREVKEAFVEIVTGWHEIKNEFASLIRETKALFVSPKKQTKDFVEKEMAKIDTMTFEGWKFEEYIAKLLKKYGYKTTVTSRSGDYGVDVIAVDPNKVRYAIQCKCYSNKLGNSPIQEVVAGMKKYNCQVGVVATNNYFTENAKELARVNDVKLWDRNTLKEMIAGRGQ